MSSLSNISTSGFGVGSASLPGHSQIITAAAGEGGGGGLSIPTTIADGGRYISPSRDRDGLFFDNDSKTTKDGNNGGLSGRASFDFNPVPASGDDRDTKELSGMDGRRQNQNQHQQAQQKCHCSILSHALSVNETENLKQENSKLAKRVKELEELLKAKENMNGETKLKARIR